MKVALALDGDEISGHFGHCQNYALFNVENGLAIPEEMLKSPGHEPGKLPLFLSEKGVELVIAGGMGPKAVDLFHANGVEVILGITGLADEVAKDYAEGKLVPGVSSCNH